MIDKEDTLAQEMSENSINIKCHPLTDKLLKREVIKVMTSKH